MVKLLLTEFLVDLQRKVEYNLNQVSILLAGVLSVFALFFALLQIISLEIKSS